MVKKDLIAAGEFDTDPYARREGARDRPRGATRRVGEAARGRRWHARDPRRRRVPLGPRGPRRGDAAPRPRRGPDRHDASFDVCEGGGEYNVARGLRRCFGLRTAARHRARRQPGRPAHRGSDPARRRRPEPRALGALRRRRPRGAQRSQLHRARLRRAGRGGLLRPRPHGRLAAAAGRHRLGRRSSAPRARAGSTAAASSRRSPRPPPRWPPRRCARPGVTATIVSYDLNYRPRCGRRSAVRSGPARSTAPSRRSSTSCSATKRISARPSASRSPASTRNLSALDPERFGAMMAQVVAAYPNIRVVATTLRAVLSASRNDWSAVCWADGVLYRSVPRPGLEILDRVGGGDSFASGLIYGLLSRLRPAAGARLRRRSRGAGHDDAGRHVHGDARRGRGAWCAARRPGCGDDGRRDERRRTARRPRSLGASALAAARRLHPRRRASRRRLAGHRLARALGFVVPGERPRPAARRRSRPRPQLRHQLRRPRPRHRPQRDRRGDRARHHRPVLQRRRARPAGRRRRRRPRRAGRQRRPRRRQARGLPHHAAQPEADGRGARSADSCATRPRRCRSR